MPLTEPRLLVTIRAQSGRIREAVRRHNGLDVWVFGSVARGEDVSDSDVDFLVRFAPESSLFDVMRLQDELSDILGCPVDVVSESALTERDDHIRTTAVAV